MQRAGTMIATIATRMTPSLPRLYAVIAAVVRRASLRTKKTPQLIPLPSSGSTPGLPHVAKTPVEFIR
jgi:hypothetical protein